MDQQSPLQAKTIEELGEALQQAIDQPAEGTGALPFLVIDTVEHGPIAVMRATDLTAVLAFLGRQSIPSASLS